MYHSRPGHRRLHGRSESVSGLVRCGSNASCDTNRFRIENVSVTSGALCCRAGGPQWSYRWVCATLLPIHQMGSFREELSNVVDTTKYFDVFEHPQFCMPEVAASHLPPDVSRERRARRNVTAMPASGWNGPTG